HETDVAVRSPTQMNAVDPDVAVHVDAVELERRDAAARTGRHPERRAVPADSRGEVAAAPARRGVLGGRPFDTPIVRQVQAAPQVVVERGPLDAGRVPERESPVRIHGQALSLARRAHCQQDEPERNCRKGADGAHLAYGWWRSRLR